MKRPKLQIAISISRLLKMSQFLPPLFSEEIKKKRLAKSGQQFVSSARSSYSHPNLLVTHQQHPSTFSDHTGPQ